MNPNLGQRLADWFEARWVTPAYSGWLTGGLSIFFFAAATNTLAGWLYVISGIMFALLVIAAVLPERSLRHIAVTRRPIEPVSAGDPLIVELLIENHTNRPKTLLQVQDMLPYVLGQPVSRSLEVVAARDRYHWVYEQPTTQRGVYRWQNVQLRTATPLGLFWCRRSQTAKAVAIVYPQVLPLTQCPLIDEMGRDVNAKIQSAHRAQGAAEGVTRTLRPYRWGDPIRLIHWRTSARYGELRVRELETFTGGQEVVICLDTAIAWDSEPFEQAVIAAASIYFYAVQQHLQVSLWTARTGIIKGRQTVLEALAATQPNEEGKENMAGDRLPDTPLLWLTHQPTRLTNLPPGSRWLLWRSPHLLPQSTEIEACPGLVIQPDQLLQTQLQSPVR